MHPLKLDHKLALRLSACTFDEFVAWISTAPAFAPSARAYRELLNVRRAEARIDPETQAFLAAYPDGMHWLVLVAEDAPETLVLLPLLDRLAEASVRISLRILREDDGFAFLSEVLDEDAADLVSEPGLPLLLMFDEDWQLQEQWGPFPQAMEPFLDAWLERNPAYETVSEDESPTAQAEYAQMLEQLAWEMRIWFNTALDVATGQELCELLRTLVDEDDIGETNLEPDIEAE